jgi:phosphoglycolate phosphatase
MKQLLKYEHIIWDWNGTLFNDVELCVDIMNGLLQRFQLPKLTIDKYQSIFTFPVEKYYEKAGLDLQKNSFQKLGKEWMDEYESRKPEASLHYKASEILREAGNSNIGQSILSAYSQDTLTEMLHNFNIHEYFQNAIGLDHIYATGKLELGKELLQKIDVPKEKIVLVGDTLHDFEVAEELGIDHILIASGHQSFERLREFSDNVYGKLSSLS